MIQQILPKIYKNFFKQNGYVILANQLTYKTKHILLNGLFDFQLDSLN